MEWEARADRSTARARSTARRVLRSRSSRCPIRDGKHPAGSSTHPATRVRRTRAGATQLQPPIERLRFARRCPRRQPAPPTRPDRRGRPLHAVCPMAFGGSDGPFAVTCTSRSGRCSWCLSRLPRLGPPQCTVRPGWCAMPSQFSRRGACWRKRSRIWTPPIRARRSRLRSWRRLLAVGRSARPVAVAQRQPARPG